MNLSAGKLYTFIEKAIAEGKKPNEEGYYIFSKNELIDGAKISPSSLAKNMAEVLRYLPGENLGWLPDNDDPIQMISDLSYSRGVLKFRRNPEAMHPSLDYYWAKHPLSSCFVYTCYDAKHRRRYNGFEAKYGYFPWSWSEEQVQSAYEEWINRPKQEGEYLYTKSEKKSPEQLRIDAIRANGGCHIKNFKLENITYNMCVVAVEKEGEALRFVPEKFRTKELYEVACKNRGMMLSVVPDTEKTKEMCELAVASDGVALQYVPNRFVDKSICMSAALSNPQALKLIPKEYITPEFVVAVVRGTKLEAISCLPESGKKNPFYLELIKHEPELIWHVPRQALTATICKTAIKAMGYSCTADAIKVKPELLGRLHTSLYDHDTCLCFVQSAYFGSAGERNRWGTFCYGFNTEADKEKGRLYLHDNFHDTYSLPDMMKWKDVTIPILKLNGYYLEFVKEDIVDEDVCYAAIEGNPHILKEIPSQYKTRELCQLAFKLDPYTIEHFPKEFITSELVLEAVRHSGFILQYIPDEFKSKEVCLIAVSDGGRGHIENVPVDILDKEICLAWLNNVDYAINPLDKIPKGLWDCDIYVASVKQDGSDLEKVPPQSITYEMCLAAVKNESRAARFVPKELFTQEIAYILVEHTDNEFDLIPKDLLNEEICISAIRHGSRYSGTVLKLIPDENKTQRMCDIAVDVSVWSLAAVPERYVTFEMLVFVANTAPGRLEDNFPVRFRNCEMIEKMIKEAPRAENALRSFI